MNTIVVQAKVHVTWTVTSRGQGKSLLIYVLSPLIDDFIWIQMFNRINKYALSWSRTDLKVIGTMSLTS